MLRDLIDKQLNIQARKAVIQHVVCLFMAL